MKLRNKRAVVTGSGRGLGREIALIFAREGAKVVTNAVHSETANSVTEEIRALGAEGLAIAADISRYNEVEHMFNIVKEKFGGVDILANSAGIVQPFPRGASFDKPSEEVTENEWKRVFEVNLDGMFYCCQAAAKSMIPQRQGRIINISSTCGVMPAPQWAAYSASKAAVIMLTKVLGLEWIKHGVYVNGIAPGGMLTDMVTDRVKTGVMKLEDAGKAHPIGRVADPKEIARLALFIASGECDFMVGQTIVADGGFVLK